MKIIENWIGQLVTVTLKDAAGGSLHGVLLGYDGGVLSLDPGEDRPQVLIPLTSVLHVTMGVRDASASHGVA